LPAIGATRFGRHTASSFIASKLGSYRCSPDPVGAVLARDKDGAILQAYRVIVHREQARLLQRSLYLLERGLPANQVPRFGRHTASSFIASKLGSYRCSPDPVGAVLARDRGDTVRQASRVIVHREQARLLQRSLYLLERGLPANQLMRLVRHIASSFFAGKPRSNRFGDRL